MLPNMVSLKNKLGNTNDLNWNNQKSMSFE